MKRVKAFGIILFITSILVLLKIQNYYPEQKTTTRFLGNHNWIELEFEGYNDEFHYQFESYSCEVIQSENSERLVGLIRSLEDNSTVVSVRNIDVKVPIVFDHLTHEKTLRVGPVNSSLHIRMNNQTLMLNEIVINQNYFVEIPNTVDFGNQTNISAKYSITTNHPIYYQSSMC